MVFDRSTELPMAKVVVEPRTVTELVAGGIGAWFAARWQWLRPRTIPIAVAALSLVAVTQAMSYLSHPPPAKSPAPSVSASATSSTYDPKPILIVIRQ
jgi:hypothetical protein